MKRIFILSLFLLPLLTNSQQWYQLFPDYDEPIYDVFCVDPYTVYFTTYYGPLLKTIDGGISWETIDDHNFTSAIYFINQDTGYVGGAFGNVYRTEDGGNSWVIQSIDSLAYSHIRDIKMVSADTIFVSMSFNSGLYYGIFRSFDGGESWEIIKQSDIEGYLTMHFFDNGYGYVLESNWNSVSSNIFKTDDFGITWNEIAAIEDITGEIYFIDTLLGFIGGVATGYSPTFVYKTTDGGILWDTVDVTDAHYITRFDFPDPSHGYFAGMYVWSDNYDYPWGLVEMSDDCGNSWDQIFYTNYYQVRSLDYVSVDTGYIVGDGMFGWENAFIMRSFDVEVSTQKTEYTKAPELFATPNPFNRKTTIDYKIPKPGNVQITIFNLYNSIVEDFNLGYKSKTDDSIEISLCNQPPGFYFITLMLEGEKQKTIKILKVE